MNVGLRLSKPPAMLRQAQYDIAQSGSIHLMYDWY